LLTFGGAIVGQWSVKGGLLHNPRMKFTRTHAIWAGALSIIAAGLLFWSSRGQAVDVVEVVQGPMRQSVVTTGRVTDITRSEVSSQSTARIEAIKVREGDPVQPGQILVQLHDDEAQAAQAQAQAALTEASERLRQVQSLQAPVSQAQLMQARAVNQQAQQELRRAEDLLRQGFVSQSRLDDALRSAHASAAALQAAQVQASSDLPGGSELALAQSRLLQAQAAQRAAAARLDLLQLRAPMAATVITRSAEPGDTAQPGKSILTLVGGGETRILASIDEKNIHLLQLGQTAQASADAYPERIFSARLISIAPAVDAQRGTVDIKLRVEPAVNFLRPDMTVSVEIVTARVANTLILPTDALRHDGAGAAFVLLSRNGRASQVAVQTGLQGIGSTQITQGLQAADRVILPGPDIGHGDKVREKATRAALANAQPLPSLTR